MAGKLSFFCIGSLVLLLSVVIFGTQSHSLNTLKLASSFGEMEGPGHGLSLRTTKHSGPNRDGGEHKSRITRLLREGRHTGPSPGEGHKHWCRTIYIYIYIYYKWKRISTLIFYIYIYIYYFRCFLGFSLSN